MDDQTTWKGHSFTLLVFAGIVVLCSIFFILGMLVGRAQGQKSAAVAAVEAAARADAAPEPKESKPDLTFFEDVGKNSKPALEPAPPASSSKGDAAPASKRDVAPASKGEAAPAPAEPPSRPQTMVSYQVGAVRQLSAAEKLLNEAKKKGFKGFILSPPARDSNPFYRVQIGPFAETGEAESARKKLEAAGYRPILKK